MCLFFLLFLIFFDKFIIYSLYRICKERGDFIYEEKEGEIFLGFCGVFGLYYWVFIFICWKCIGVVRNSE